jgi:hypothetical protein
MSAKNRNKIGNSSAIRWLPESALKIDPSYQRPLKRGTTKSIVSKFNERYLGTILVSYRGGGNYYIIDGQHRIAALREVGLAGVLVRCQVYTGLSVSEEADMYLGANHDSKRGGGNKVTSVDMFTARKRAGDVAECEIYAQLSERGLSVGSSASHVRAVAALASLHKTGVLDTVLDVCLDWSRKHGDDMKAFDNKALRGVGSFVRKHGDGIDMRHLLSRLKGASPGDVLQKMEGAKSFFGANINNEQAACMVLRQLYNKRLRKTRQLTD